MIWGVLLTGAIACGLAYGLAQLWPLLSLTELAYWGGVRGIAAAFWRRLGGGLMGSGRHQPTG